MTKRMVIGLGSKGGTGKTLYFRGLYYFLIESGVKTLGIDADVENPDFYAHHKKSHPVRRIDFLESGEMRDIMNLLQQEQADVVLIDMPGAAGERTREQLQKFGVFKNAAKLGYRVTFSTVLNNQMNTIVSLKMMMDFVSSDADYVAIKSLMWNQGSLNYSRWDKSKTREQFLDLGGIEIEMPILDLATFDSMHETGTSFFEIESKLQFGDQCLAESFLDRSRPELKKAARFLGLPWTEEPKQTQAKAKRSTKKVSGDNSNLEEIGVASVSE